MAMPTVIAKNQTGTDIDLERLGLRVPAAGQLTLTDFSTYTECTEDEDLETQTAAGNIVINDGTIDLSTAEALVYLDSSGNLNGPPTGAAANLLLKLLDTSGERTVVTGVTVDGSDNIVTPGSVTASNFFLTGGNPFGLQEAYDNGNDIITAGATDIAFTLTSGGFIVQGSGAVAFGSVTEVASFGAFSAGTLSLQSRDTTLLDMQANDAASKTLTISASNAGAGAGNLLVNVDDLTTITSQLGESSGLLRLTQAGTGGDSADFFVGTSNPSGTISARAASIFLRDTGATGEIYLNTSAGTGTTWSQLTSAAPVTLQNAYDNGATITTAGAVDIAFTLASGDFTVQGGGNVTFGDTTPLGSFTVDSGTMSLDSTDTTNLTMTANDAGTKTLTISATNAGAGSGDLTVDADGQITVGGTNTSAAEVKVAGGVDTEILTLTQTTGESFGIFAGTANPSGTVTADAGSLFFQDTGTGAEVYQNVSTGSGTEWALVLNDINHKALLHLIHFLDDGPGDGFASGSYKETLYGTTGGAAALISEEIWWTTSGKTQRIVDLTVTYTGALPTTEVWRMYDSSGTLAVTLTDAITYSGAFETTRTRTWV